MCASCVRQVHTLCRCIRERSRSSSFSGARWTGDAASIFQQTTQGCRAPLLCHRVGSTCCSGCSDALSTSSVWQTICDCNLPHINKRLQVWAEKLDAFDVTIVYRAGTHNANADGLSRQAWQDDEEQSGAQRSLVLDENRGLLWRGMCGSESLI